MPRDPFVTWYDHRLECTSVWNGKDYLLACQDMTQMTSMPSSLVLDGPAVGPAKPVGTRGQRAPRAAGITSRTALS